MYLMTSFQRLWRFSARQQVPCGNVMDFLLPKMREWHVAPNTTAREKGIVQLRSRMAKFEGTPTSPWLCELQKKSLVMADNHQLYKYVACCNPDLKESNQELACCVQKEGAVDTAAV